MSVAINYLKPKDIIAGLIVLGFIILKLKGINGSLDTSIALIMGYYFVKRSSHIDSGK